MLAVVVVDVVLVEVAVVVVVAGLVEEAPAGERLRSDRQSRAAEPAVGTEAIPRPSRQKTIVWELTVCQTPGVAGLTGGRWWPSTWLTGLEKVSVRFVVGVILVPGSGVATTLARLPRGNHEIVVVVGFSQERTAAATAIVPAAAVVLSVTALRGLEISCGSKSLPGAPEPTTWIGSLKRTVSGRPAARVRYVEVRCATGATSVMLTCWVLPASQEIQLGRLIVAITVMRSPCCTFFVGQIVRPRRATGMSVCSRPPTAETRSIVPPP